MHESNPEFTTLTDALTELMPYANRQAQRYLRDKSTRGHEPEDIAQTVLAEVADLFTRTQSIAHLKQEVRSRVRQRCHNLRIRSVTETQYWNQDSDDCPTVPTVQPDVPNCLLLVDMCRDRSPALLACLRAEGVEPAEDWKDLMQQVLAHVGVGTLTALDDHLRQ